MTIEDTPPGTTPDPSTDDSTQSSISSNATTVTTVSGVTSDTVLKVDDGSAAETNGDAAPDLIDKVATEVRQESKGWISAAPLYCSKNGRSHAILLDFNFTECPKCRQDLTVKNLDAPEGSTTESSDSGSTSDSDDEAQKAASEDDDDKPAGEPEDLLVTHLVKYVDVEDGVITTQRWRGAFDLNAARKGIKMKKSVFEVLTIVDTSIAPLRYRSSYVTNRIIRAGIVDNPNVSVSVRTRRITIQSKALITAIGAVVSYYPSVSLGGTIMALDEPYPLIAHNIEKLKAFRATYTPKSNDHGQPLRASSRAGFSRQCTEEESEHLGILLKFVQDYVYKDNLREEEARSAKGLCTFRMLWLLFIPGKTVYVESDGKRSAFVVQSVEMDSSILSNSQDHRMSYQIDLWNLKFDGRFVGRSSRLVIIPPFDGERAITSLKVFPSEFIDKEDNGKTKEQLEQNGKRWFELLRGGQVYYSGELLGTSRKHCEGRVYIDPSSYYSQNPDAAPEICDTNDTGQELAKCSCEECHGLRPHPPTGFMWARYDLIDPFTEADLTLEGSEYGLMHRYLLCEDLLYGFVLKSRTWEKLDVACCFPPKINIRAIDTLVMPSERKDMIKALVQKYTAKKPKEGSLRPWGADFIESKGEGQIFLLHGSPGVGKTYTTECIAEYTNRPLLSLTCGDIGTNEVKVEEELSKWFRLAEKWGAVMLLDEADIYLEMRLTSDLQRNSLVSVFLRCIEYYRGILFLTTNRVGQFDDAFTSRIHVIIKYDMLSEDDCKKIWSQFFDKLSDEREDFIITGRAKAYVLDDEAITSMGWNGREIRNAFQTAVALAEFRLSQNPNKTKHDNPTLDQRDFEQVCRMTKQFKQYLIDVHGDDEEGRAFRAKARAGHSHPSRANRRSNV
ncbi:hypothetical protein DL770_009078 [Monosporascus sp. CRB-9-2]|nr:hypothetical protein DL770_009078 [Monosporascus sp. CRB-9-2]